MTTSKHLITALEKSDWMDRMLIFAGLAFFVLVVLFIIKQRLVDRGLRVAFFWTRFLPDFGGDEALLAAAEKGEATGLSLSASSVVSAAVSTAVATASTIATSLVNAAPSIHSKEVLESSVAPGATTETAAESVWSDPSLPEGVYTTTSSDGAEPTGAGSTPHDEL